jgi:glycosyltransferase involved in cell wall biosynthesis
MVQKTLKICVAGPSGQRGGLEIHTSQLASFFKRQGYSVLTIDVKDLRGHRLLFINAIFKIIQWAQLIIKTISFAPDIMVSTATGSGYQLLARFANKNCFRIIQIVTEDYPVNDQRMLRVVSSYDAVAAQTPILQRQVHNKLSCSIPCQVLPCFHQIELLTPFQCKHEYAPNTVISLAYFGRLAGNKGLIELVHAWYQLRLPSTCKLDIWGSGPLQTELTQLLRSFPKDHHSIRINGPYPAGSDYTNLLMRYDGLVMPSQSTEGLPLVLLEAAAVGLPILTTAIGGIPDFANNNPDVVLVGLGLPHLRTGLENFIRAIRDGCFCRSRQRDFFSERYSFSVLEDQWIQMLNNPSQFFGITIDGHF